MRSTSHCRQQTITLLDGPKTNRLGPVLAQTFKASAGGFGTGLCGLYAGSCGTRGIQLTAAAGLNG